MKVAAVKCSSCKQNIPIVNQTHTCRRFSNVVQLVTVSATRGRVGVCLQERRGDTVGRGLVSRSHRTMRHIWQSFLACRVGLPMFHCGGVCIPLGGTTHATHQTMKVTCLITKVTCLTPVSTLAWRSLMGWCVGDYFVVRWLSCVNVSLNVNAWCCHDSVCHKLSTVWTVENIYHKWWQIGNDIDTCI